MNKFKAFLRSINPVKILIYVISVPLCAILFTYIIAILFVFFSHVEIIDKHLNRLHKTEKELSGEFKSILIDLVEPEFEEKSIQFCGFRAILKISSKKNDIKNRCSVVYFVSNTFIRNIYPNEKILTNKFRRFIWYNTLPIYLSKKEILSLFVSTYFMDKSYKTGLYRASISFFEKNPSDLKTKEIIKLIIYSQGSLYRNNKQKFLKMEKKLHKKIQVGKRKKEEGSTGK